MKRELPPITEPVTREELNNILLREIYSARNLITKDFARDLLSAVGKDYDTEKAAADKMTDAEILQMIRS